MTRQEDLAETQGQLNEEGAFLRAAPSCGRCPCAGGAAGGSHGVRLWNAVCVSTCSSEGTRGFWFFFAGCSLQAAFPFCIAGAVSLASESHIFNSRAQAQRAAVPRTHTALGMGLILPTAAHWEV